MWQGSAWQTPGPGCPAALAAHGAGHSASGCPPLTVPLPDLRFFLAPRGQPCTEGRSTRTACWHPPTSAAGP